jgi:hypothetical protein
MIFPFDFPLISNAQTLHIDCICFEDLRVEYNTLDWGIGVIAEEVWMLFNHRWTAILPIDTRVQRAILYNSDQPKPKSIRLSISGSSSERGFTYALIFSKDG